MPHFWILHKRFYAVINKVKIQFPPVRVTLPTLFSPVPGFRQVDTIKMAGGRRARSGRERETALTESLEPANSLYSCYSSIKLDYMKYAKRFPHENSREKNPLRTSQDLLWKIFEGFLIKLLKYVTIFHLEETFWCNVKTIFRLQVPTWKLSLNTSNYRTIPWRNFWSMFECHWAQIAAPP